MDLNYKGEVGQTIYTQIPIRFGHMRDIKPDEEAPTRTPRDLVFDLMILTIVPVQVHSSSF
jgi:hypothetical protein